MSGAGVRKCIMECEAREMGGFGDSVLVQGGDDRRPISEQVVTRISGMIKSGNLKPGDRLPTEAQMGIAFGISRPALREALKALTLMGILEVRQGGRYTVTELRPSRLMAPYNAILSGVDYDPAEHCETRMAVEGELVRLCALRASGEARQRILALAHDGGAFLDDPAAFRMIDVEFHQALNNGAGNRMLAVLAEALYDTGLDQRREASALPGVIAVSVAQHVEVAEAIGRGEAEAARLAYLRHLEHVRDMTLASMQAATGAASPA